MNNQSIAIIGAGIAGIACARVLVEAGHHVTVFEKSRGVGGRMATRQTEVGGFDHGAQLGYAASSALQSALQTAQRDAHCQIWSPSPPYFLPVPSMNAWVKALLPPVEDRFVLRLGQRVKRIEPLAMLHGSARCNPLCLKIDVADSDNELEITEGLFDVVIVATPAEQAVELLSPVSVLSAEAARVQSQVIWSLMLAFSEPVVECLPSMAHRPLLGTTKADMPYLMYPAHHRLGMIAHESAKPGRRPGERWVVQANPVWSAENRHEAADRVRDKLVAAFSEVMHTARQPIHATVHRWLYAMPTNPLIGPFLWDPAQQIGACGDWFEAATSPVTPSTVQEYGKNVGIHHFIEAAYLSGTQLGEKVAAQARQ